jgi:hypothetical protein
MTDLQYLPAALGPNKKTPIQLKPTNPPNDCVS